MKFMSYLICDKCGGYYELQEGESPEDFDVCQCGGELLYKKSIQTANNSKPSYKRDNDVVCPVCGEPNKGSSVKCPKCGSFIRRKEIASNKGLDYQHVIEQGKKKNLIDRFEWWGIASGVIFFIVVQIISSILLFGGLLRLASSNAGVGEASTFLSGSMLVTIIIMIASGFIAVATIKTRDYITGMINSGMVGAFIGFIVGIFGMLAVVLLAGFIGQENAGIIGGLLLLIFYVIIYAVITASGGLIAVYVRRHTSII